MTTAVRTEQDCKLTYALTTTPNPLTASPPNIIPGTEDEHAFADIDIVISNTGNKPVRCSRIAVVLPVGSYARDLAVTGEGIDAYVSPETQWTIVDIQSDVLLAVPTTETAVFAPPDDTTAEPSQARFEVVPRSGREIEVDGLYIHLSGIKVSTKSGTARIGIEEWATDTEGPLPEVPNTGRLDVAKFPFRSGSDPHPGIGRALVALTGTGQPPATKIDAGVALVLEWHHLRGDNHELYADGKRVGSTQAELEAIAGGSRWEITEGLRRDTAFALKTSTPTPTGGHVVRWDHVTVCVSDQTLAALTISNTLVTEGAVTAETTLTVGGALAPGTAFSVTGAASTTSLTATDTVKGTSLTATGAVKGTTVTADGLGSFGSTSTGSLTASGEIKANGGATVPAGTTLSVKGKAEILRAATYTVFSAAVSSGLSKKFRAQSDGFLSASIYPTSTLTVTPANEFFNVFGVTIDVQSGESARASTTQVYRKDYASGGDSATALVPAGKEVTIKIYNKVQPPANFGSAHLYLYWRPLGGDSPLVDLGSVPLISPDNADTPPVVTGAEPDPLA